MNGEFKEFDVKLDVDYVNCQFIIEKILKNFDAKIFVIYKPYIVI